MTDVAGMALIQAAVNGASALWATLFFAACVLIAILRQKLTAEQKHTESLRQQVDFSSRRRRVAMELFHTLGSAFESSITLESLLRSVVAFFMRIAQATGGVAFLVDGSEQALYSISRCGTLGGQLARQAEDRNRGTADPSRLIRFGEGIVGEVALSGRPVFINDCESDTRLNFLGIGSIKIKNAMAVPLRFRDHALGVIVVVNRLTEDGEVGRGFGRFEFQLLEALAVYAATAVYLTISYLEQAQKQRLEFDLSVAGEIQRLLLPQFAPSVTNVTLSGHSRPAYRVGGDYYDFIELGGSRLGVLIADVSGKGVTGALVMAICRSIVHSHARQHAEPAEAIREFHRLLLPDLPEDQFITMTYGILDTRNRQFTFARAGHDPLVCYRADSRTVEIHMPRGSAIGLGRKDRFDSSLEQETLTLGASDAVILYTDGITEALNPLGDEYGTNRLMNLISEKGALGAEELAQAVLKSLQDFEKDTPMLDDQTLVVIKSS